VSLSPLQLVGMIGAVIGLNVGCFYLLEALPKWLRGSRRTPALAGVLAVFLAAMTADIAVALRAGHQAANFAFLGLLPPVILMRAAVRVSPRGLQYSLLAAAMVGAGAIVAILLGSLAEGPQNGWTWTLMTLFVALPLAFAGMSLRRIRSAVNSNDKPPTETGTPA
jgi:hypothetical protein